MSEQETFPDLNPSDDLEEFDETEMPITPSYVQRMNEFLEREKIDDDEPKFYLYKYDNYDSGKQKSTVARYSEGQTPPDEHDIGMQFGSGRYGLCLVVSPCKKFPKGKMRMYRFRINPVYDEYRKDTQPAQPLPPAVVPPPPVYQQPAPAPQNNFSSMSDTLSLIEKIVTMITPFFINRQQPKNDGVNETIRDTYSVVSEVMKSQLVENFKMIQEMQMNQFQRNEELNSIKQEEKEPGIIEKYAPLLAEFIPQILGGGPKSALLSGLVKNAPEMQKLLKDESQLNAVVTHLVETQGMEATAALLDKLGIQYEVDPQYLQNQQKTEPVQTDAKPGQPKRTATRKQRTA